MRARTILLSPIWLTRVLSNAALTRMLSTGAAAGERSVELAVEGAVTAAVGMEEIEIAKGARKTARKLEKQGIKQVAAGAEAVGQAEAIGAVAVAFDEAAQ